MADDQNTRIQRQMALLFPFISLTYGSLLPAGLFLYWIVSTLFTIVQQYLIIGWGGMFPLFGWNPGFARDHSPRFPVDAAATGRAVATAAHVRPRRTGAEPGSGSRQNHSPPRTRPPEPPRETTMSAYKEFSGKSVEEALRAARDEFGVELSDLDFEILTPGSRGVLGMGAEPARIVAAPRSALGGAAPKREAAASTPLPPPPPREDRGHRRRSQRLPRRRPPAAPRRPRAAARDDRPQEAGGRRRPPTRPAAAPAGPIARRAATTAQGGRPPAPRRPRPAPRRARAHRR